MQRNVVQMTAIQHKAGIARHFLYRWRVAAALTMCVLALNGPAVADPENWRHEWPRTDFTQTNVDLSEIKSGGPPKTESPPSTHLSSKRFPQAEPGAGFVASIPLNL